jgi:type IV secretory pathway TrbD component
MKYNNTLPAILILAGTALSGWGLFSPLMTFPLGISFTYSQPDFGGSGALTAAIIILMLASAGVLVKGLCRPIGWCCAGMAAGLLAGTLHIRRAWVEDKLMQLADATGQMDEGIEALLAKMELSTGVYALGAGLLLWCAGLMMKMFSAKKP